MNRFLALYLFLGKENDNHIIENIFHLTHISLELFSKSKYQNSLLCLCLQWSCGRHKMDRSNITNTHIRWKLRYIITAFWNITESWLSSSLISSKTCDHLLIFSHTELPVCIADCATESLMNVYIEHKNSYWHLYHIRDKAKIPYSPPLQQHEKLFEKKIKLLLGL